MCHLILFLPIFGLAVFLIWPFAIAAPVYGGLLLVSGLLYAVVIRALHLPVRTGPEGMAGMQARVIAFSGTQGQVRVCGEIWNTASTDDLQAGDCVEVVCEDRDMTLRVQKLVNVGSFSDHRTLVEH